LPLIIRTIGSLAIQHIYPRLLREFCARNVGMFVCILIFIRHTCICILGMLNENRKSDYRFKKQLSVLIIDKKIIEFMFFYHFPCENYTKLKFTKLFDAFILPIVYEFHPIWPTDWMCLCLKFVRSWSSLCMNEQVYCSTT
jgi:hypothetical protein